MIIFTCCLQRQHFSFVRRDGCATHNIYITSYSNNAIICMHKFVHEISINSIPRRMGNKTDFRKCLFILLRAARMHCEQQRGGRPMTAAACIVLRTHAVADKWTVQSIERCVCVYQAYSAVDVRKDGAQSTGFNHLRLGF